MSYQAYIDHLMINGRISRACIIGKGGDVKAASPGYELSDRERGAITNSIFQEWNLREDMDIMLNGTKFVSVSARRFMVSGRAGDKACHIAMTPHHFIIAEADPPIRYQASESVVRELADRMKDSGQ